MAHLIVCLVHGNTSKKLADQPLMIGRLPEHDIPLLDPRVSKQHARISPSDDGWYIEDLKSTNGTFLQDVRGQETFVRRDSTELTDEGTIGLGRAEDPGSNLAIYYKTIV